MTYAVRLVVDSGSTWCHAARADAVAEQLKSAQALIQQDRALCNGQTELSNINEKIVSQGTSRGAPKAGVKTSQVFISA